jgi:hypothetical protein
MSCGYGIYQINLVAIQDMALSIHLQHCHRLLTVLCYNTPTLDITFLIENLLAIIKQFSFFMLTTCRQINPPTYYNVS